MWPLGKKEIIISTCYTDLKAFMLKIEFRFKVFGWDWRIWKEIVLFSQKDKGQREETALTASWN